MCKRLDQKMRFVEEIKNNIRKINFEALVLALYCYYRDNVKNGPLSKNLLQRKQQHGP